MPPAARVTDMHTCPMVTGIVPHVGGPILPPGAPTVLIGMLPAATVTNMCTCVGPPDVIVKGSSGVLINFLPAARMGDMTAHGGVIVLGEPTVMIGEVGGGGAGPGAGGGAGGAASVVAGTSISGADKDSENASLYSEGGASTRGPGADSQDAASAGASTGEAAAAATAPPGKKLDDIAKGVNPSNGTDNCGNIIDADLDRLSGKDPDAVAPNEKDGSFDEIEARHNTKLQWGSSLDDAYDAVQAGGDGTTAIVGIGYSGNTASHVVVMSNDNGTVGIIEGQDWGPGNPKGVITDPAVANQRYNADGGSNIGWGIVPK